MKKIILSMLLLLLGLSSTSFANTPSYNDVEGYYETVSLAEVMDILNKNKGILLDVRNNDEVEKTGLVKGAKHIPLPELEKRLPELNKDETYITFCVSGNRSKKAAEILKKNGFKNVYNSKEGMSTWPYKDMGEPVKK